MKRFLAVSGIVLLALFLLPEQERARGWCVLGCYMITCGTTASTTIRLVRLSASPTPQMQMEWVALL